MYYVILVRVYFKTGITKTLIQQCILFIFCCLLLSWNKASYAQTKVRVGVQKVWGEQAARRMWQPSIDYLNQHITSHHFTLVPLSLRQTRSAIAQQEIDFITTNPENYIGLEASHGISRLLTLVKLHQGIPSSRFGAVILTRRDRNDINKLADLRGKSFMAVSETAFGGFQMAWLELKRHRIDPFKDFSSFKFSGFPQDKVIHAIANKEVDAGTVRTDTLEHMAHAGLIKLADFKVLARKTSPGFPFAHSTPLYPEWPLASLKHTPADLAKAVAVALLNMPSHSTAAQAASSHGWTVPLDYHTVRELMQELKLGPFSHASQLTLKTVFIKFWWVFLLFLMLICPPTIAYVKALQLRIKKYQDYATTESDWNNALNFLDEPFCMVDLDDRLLRANHAFYKKIGHQAEHAIGQSVALFFHAPGEEQHCKICQARKERRDAVIIMETDDPLNKNGEPVEIRVNVVRDNNNQATAIIQGFRSLAQIRQAETALRENEIRLRSILDATPDPLLIANEQGKITLINREFENCYGYTREEVVGKKLEYLVPDSVKLNHVNLRNQYMHNPVTRPKVQSPGLFCMHKSGRKVPVEISLSPLTTDEGLFVTAAIRDISVRLEAEKELRRLASFAQKSPLPIIELTTSGEISYLNPLAEKLFPNLEAEGLNLVLIQQFDTLLAQLQKNNNELSRSVEINGAAYDQKITYEEEQELIRIYFWDTTRIRDMRREMAYQASHDSLTNLFNRQEFEFRLQQALETVEYENKKHVLCYIDIDQFKIINDTCGHTIGDELIKQISTVIMSNLRESDILARLGGDEFGLLLMGCPVDNAHHIAEKIRASIEAFRFYLDSKNYKFTISIGMVPISEKGLTANDVLAAADTACYIAKESGRNNIHIYNPNDATSTRHSKEMSLVNEIHAALDENRFELYAQEVLNPLDEKKTFYEILLRMREPGGELITPLAFLPAAERYGLMLLIDKWVIQNTMHTFCSAEFQDINVSINLSGQTLSDENILNYIIRLFGETGFDSQRLIFEVTETAMVANFTAALRFITTLKSTGCRFALDDFGSGFSSFAYLKNLPVDLIKIDGLFIRDINHDFVNAALVESFIQIGQRLNLATVAEFVENEVILNTIKPMGIDYVQGYAIGYPMPIEELKKMHRSKQLLRKH